MARKRSPACAKWSEEDFLTTRLAALLGHIDNAAKQGSWSAVAQFERQLLSVRKELDQIRAAKSASELPSDHESYLVELLRELKVMRTQAKTQGSWVAAASLAKLEMEAAGRLEAHRLALEAGKRPDYSLPELVELIQEKIQGLPPVVRQKFELIQGGVEAG